MKKILLGLCLIAAIASSAAAGIVDFFNGVKIGAALPDNDMQFLGEAVATKGHPALIDFWASWCEPCRAAVPRLNGWQEKFASQGLIVIGVSQESKEDVAAFLDKLPMHYAVAVEGAQSLHKALKIRGLPYAILVDREGKIAWRGQPEDLNDDVIAALLAK